MQEKFSRMERLENLEERGEIVIGDKFWSLLLQRMGLSKKNSLANPERIRVVFNSQNEFFAERVSFLKKRDADKYILAGYDIETGGIEVKGSIDDIRGDDLSAVLVHEMVHYVQDSIDMYPDMRAKKTVAGYKENDKKALPWEKQAYAIMDLLKDDFNKYCKIIIFE